MELVKTYITRLISKQMCTGGPSARNYPGF